jgi:ubiquinone/menaquinone biosynthesis C-methylase UbiE
MRRSYYFFAISISTICLMENKLSNAFRNFEHEGWQKAAGQYDLGFGAVTSQAVDSLLHAVAARSGVRLLDIACGPGYVAASAARLGCSVVGIDFSSEMIALAKEMLQHANPDIEFREGDAENLELPGSSFDAVVMNFGMLHLALPDKAIAEAFRVLRPGGRYAFTVWDAPPKTAGFEIVLDAVRTHGNMNVSLPDGPPFFRFSDPFESARSLKEVGFENIKTVVVPQVWKLKAGADLFRTMRRAAVRTAALLNMQSPEALAKIEKEISERAEQYRTQGGIELPMPAMLTSAARPAVGRPS